MERECLLAAFNVLHGYAATGDNPTTLDFASFISHLPAIAPGTPRELPAPAAASEEPSLPAPAAVPAPRYIHPELRQIGSEFGGNVARVKWAIERMTDDYSLTDLQRLISREGYTMKGSEISVVLTRLKRQGHITEVTRSHGPKPAIFRKPEPPAAVPAGVEEYPPGAVAEPLIVAAA